METAREFTRRMAEDGLQGNLYGLLCSIEVRDATIRQEDAEKLCDSCAHGIGTKINDCSVFPSNRPIFPCKLRAAIIKEEKP